MPDLIRVENLSFAYEEDVPVLGDISFELRPGTFCALMGGNGSGKTTLLKCLSSLLKIPRGRILVNGNDLAVMARREIARSLSMVPQEHSLVFPYTVKDMVLMGRAPYIDTFAMPGRADRHRAQAALEDVGIAHLSGKLFTRISGGERQLTMIARALAQDTPVMLLDEPTSHLDFRNQIRTLSIVRRLVREKGLLAVMATHDPNHVLQFADYVMVIEDGRLALKGRPDAVINRENIAKIYGVDVEEIRHAGSIRGIIPQTGAREDGCNAD